MASPPTTEPWIMWTVIHALFPAVFCRSPAKWSQGPLRQGRPPERRGFVIARQVCGLHRGLPAAGAAWRGIDGKMCRCPEGEMIVCCCRSDVIRRHPGVLHPAARPSTISLSTLIGRRQSGSIGNRRCRQSSRPMRRGCPLPAQNRPRLPRGAQPNSDLV